MKYISVLLYVFLMISPIVFLNGTAIFAEEQTLEVELSVEEDVPLVEYGEETTINLTFTQRGFNWTELSETGRPLKDLLFAKVYLPIMFRSIVALLGYNSVVFETNVVGNPLGWEAWVTPSSVSYFTGDKSANLKLHVKVSRPTTANTAVIRITFTAYGGDNSIMGVASSDVLVSIKQYHLAEVTAVTQFKEVTPDTIVYFPIEVTNRGNYEDTFGFKISNESNGFLGLVSGQLTLSPGETGHISAMLLTPDTFLYDFGSKTSLNISAYSVYEPAKKFSTVIQIVSRGFFISELFIFTIALIFIILIFVYIVSSYILEKRNIEFYGKPVKPWTIPEEKKYLEKLKKKDKEEYDNVRRMMKDEYQSALLWFKSYRDMIKKKGKSKSKKNGKGGFLTDFFGKTGEMEKTAEKTKSKEKKAGKKESQKQAKEKRIKSEKLEAESLSEEKQKEERTENIFTKSFKKLLRKQETKEQKAKNVTTQKTPELKPKESENEEKGKRTDRSTEMKKSRKERIILKIKREQEKTENKN
jgi:hypothetical protein